MSRRLFLKNAALSTVAVTTASTVGSPATASQNKDPSFYLVDAFSNSPFSGNPAPVVFLTHWLADEKMQALSHEMNMSEIAFVIKDGKNWKIRWFTPAKEVDLNGHATLAAASVIFEKLEPTLTEVTFIAKAGPLNVQRDGAAYLMNFPADSPPVQVEVPPEAEADLGVKPSEYWINKRNIAVFKNAEEVAAVRSKITKDSTWTQKRHLMITAPGQNGVDYVLRYFAPLLDIPEDPVSGVVHCTLAPFWAARLSKNSFNVVQLSPRGGRARTGIDPQGRVLIGGPCATYVEGHLVI